MSSSQSGTNFGYVFCVFYILDSKISRFDLMWLFCLLFKHKKLFLKLSLFWSHLNAFEYAYLSDLSPTLKDFLEDSWKTLERLLKDFLESFLMYYMLEDFSRNLREVFRSLLPKVVQKNDVKWSPSLSMLRNDI